eukprot:2758513-Prymnesium_polylepis.1
MDDAQAAGHSELLPPREVADVARHDLVDGCEPETELACGDRRCDAAQHALGGRLEKGLRKHLGESILVELGVGGDEALTCHTGLEFVQCARISSGHASRPSPVWSDFMMGVGSQAARSMSISRGEKGRRRSLTMANAMTLATINEMKPMTGVT